MAAFPLAIGRVQYMRTESKCFGCLMSCLTSHLFNKYLRRLLAFLCSRARIVQCLHINIIPVIISQLNVNVLISHATEKNNGLPWGIFPQELGPYIDHTYSCISK